MLRTEEFCDLTYCAQSNTSGGGMSEVDPNDRTLRVAHY
jgi:hypothetical protein